MVVGLIVSKMGRVKHIVLRTLYIIVNTMVAIIDPILYPGKLGMVNDIFVNGLD